jgi:hypothetical protein
VQLSSCKIKVIEEHAFKGQENFLKNLNLQDNVLNEVPTRALSSLKRLSLLDLSKNKITVIPNDSFRGLNELVTLKLMDNNLTLSRYSFRGLEGSLKNLNLKGTKQKRVPDAIKGLKKLAFLDLSLNGIRELPGSSGSRTFEDLESLTALNLERNLISNLGESAFQGTRKTLSSLSLLNNLLSEFPIGAIHSLKQLKVLDIGFNLITSIPEHAFRGNPFVTLLALDGNPLPYVTEKTLLHLNKTLRGLSIGGRFLNCDCKLKWVAEWIRNGELQVTSRERNPQFCGSPLKFRERGFYSIPPEEFICDSSIQEGSTNSIEALIPKPFSNAITPSSTTLFVTPSSSTPIRRSQDKSSSPRTSSTSPIPVNFTRSSSTSTEKALKSSTPSQTTTLKTTVPSTTTKSPIKANGNWRQQQITTKRPPLVLGHTPLKGQSQAIDDSKEIQVKNAFR